MRLNFFTAFRYEASMAILIQSFSFKSICIPNSICRDVAKVWVHLFGARSFQLSSYDADVKCVYAARCGEEGGSARAGQRAPLPAHGLTGALIPAKTLSRRHFVHKVRSACARAYCQMNTFACIILLFDVHNSVLKVAFFIESQQYAM